MVVIWGEEYTRLFADITFKCACAAGLLEDPKDTIELYCSPYTATQLNNPRFNKHVCIADAPTDKYGTISHCTQLALREFSNCELAYICPDVLYLGDFFRKMRTHLDRYDAVMMQGFRCDRKALGSMYGMNARTAISYALANLHPITKMHSIDTFHSGWPSVMYAIGNNAIASHAWHWHPAAIRLSKPLETSGTIDYDLMLKANIPDERIHHVVDSDDMCAIEMSSTIGESADLVQNRPNTQSIAEWAKRVCSPFDRRLFRKCSVWHSYDIDAGTISLMNRVSSVANEVIASFDSL